MKTWQKWISLWMALVMALGMMTAGFAETAAETEAPAETETAESAAAEDPILTAARELFGPEAEIYVHHGQLTFAAGSCVDHPITDMDSAAQVVERIAALMTAEGENLQFIPWRTLRDTVGNVYYTFQQMAGGITVCGGAMKIITDSEGQMIGVSSSAILGVPVENEEQEITAAQAEEVVLNHAGEAGQNGVALLEGMTEKIILSLLMSVEDDQEVEDQSRYVWVVYTNNPSANVASSSDLPYSAHYVSMSGEYLYSLPTVLPGDEVGSSGFDASYVFEFMEPVDYTGYVDMADGSEREITVTVMRDRRTGMYYLGNMERRIVVADCWQFLYNNGTVQLESSRDNLEWDQVALKSLYNYCRVYDYYREIGWIGANGEGLPILILNNYCDKLGNPVDNAAFVGDYLGWSIFLASQANSYSECLDVIAHEYTHCVTGATMTYNAYANDYGAINEGMSDIQGQLCELMMDPDPDDEWLLGENSGEAIRSMSAPLQYTQPEYTWDLYYQPNVAVPGILNDQGGVHTNSSLLNRVGYLLCNEGGMSLTEARAYWFAVDCAMVPGTDYVQLRELLPWVLKAQGLTPYQDTLTAVLDTVKLGDESLPESLTEDRALLMLTLPETEAFADGFWGLDIISVDVSGMIDMAVQMLESMSEASSEGESEEEGFSVFSLLGALFSMEEAEEVPAAETAETEETPAMGAEEAISEEDGESEGGFLDGIRAWLIELIRPYLYQSMGAAGQDGRTIRMIAKEGYTIPIMIHLNVDEETMIASEVTTLICLGQKWYNISDVSEMMNQADDEETAEEATEETEAESTAESALEQMANNETFQEIVTDMLDAIFGGKGITSMVFHVEGGKVCEIPAQGLESITLADSVMSMNDDSEAEYTPRMSRPKMEETVEESAVEEIAEEQTTAE